MSLVAAFQPLGPTVLVGVTALQVPGASAAGSFRVRCLVTAYLTWGTQSTVTAAGAPVAGTPSPATVGMTAGNVEKITLPGNSYFISSVAASFEITPGEGI